MDNDTPSQKQGWLKRQTSQFWEWYEANYKLNLTVAVVLFVLQIVHLLWLGVDVSASRLIGHPLVPVSAWFENVLVIVDYFEIPALASVSLVYIHEYRKTRKGKNLVYLFLLNTQWIHMFWITDEFVVGKFNGSGPTWPAWLAWVAIGIDYLELPVMFDTIRRFYKATVKGEGTILEALKEQDSAAAPK